MRVRGDGEGGGAETQKERERASTKEKGVTSSSLRIIRHAVTFGAELLRLSGAQIIFSPFTFLNY